MAGRFVTPIEQAQSVVEYNKRVRDRKINTILDRLWEMVDAHQPPDPHHCEDYNAGHDAACREIRKMIEAEGGMLAGARRIHEFVDNEQRREAAE